VEEQSQSVSLNDQNVTFWANGDGNRFLELPRPACELDPFLFYLSVPLQNGDGVAILQGLQDSIILPEC
jgi:hypothetical protein